MSSTTTGGYRKLAAGMLLTALICVIAGWVYQNRDRLMSVVSAASTTDRPEIVNDAAAPDSVMTASSDPSDSLPFVMPDVLSDSDEDMPADTAEDGTSDQTDETIPVRLAQAASSAAADAGRNGIGGSAVPLPETIADGGISGGPVEAFTEPWDDVKLAASEMGTLSEVFAKEGDVVAAGQVLATLDDLVLQASLEVADAARSSEGALRSAAADLARREADLKKLTELRKRNHASLQEVERMAADVEIARARRQSVEDELVVRRREYERVQAQLRQRQVRAPIDGVVTEVFKQVGEFVSPSDPVVVRVVRLDPLKIEFSVPQAIAAQFSSGDSVGIRIDRTSGQTSGTVDFVSPVADPSTGTVRLKVRLPNPEQQIRSGLRATLVTD